MAEKKTETYRNDKEEHLHELYDEADLLDARKRRIVVIGLIVGIIAVAALVYLFLFMGGPAESPTSYQLALGMATYNMAFMPHYVPSPIEGGEPVQLPASPEEITAGISEALVILNEVALNPGSDFDRDSATMYVGICALQLGDLDQAEEKLTLASTSEFPVLARQSAFTLGSILLERGQLDESYSHYEGIAAEEGNHLILAAKLEMAKILAWQGKSAESKALLEEIVELGKPAEGEEEIIQQDRFVLQAENMLTTGYYETSLVDLIPMEVELVEVSTPEEGAAALGAERSTEEVVEVDATEETTEDAE